MDLPGTSYLFTLAALSVTFVGFSALAIILRQTFGGEVSPLDLLITRIFIQLGFIVVAGSMLPPLFMLFDWPAVTIWRIASLFPAIPSTVFAITYPGRRKKASGLPTPWFIWLDVTILGLAALALYCNALGLGFTPGPAPYAAALTTILFLSGLGYLQALDTLVMLHTRRRARADKP